LIPLVDSNAQTPCRNEEVSGRRLPNGEVVDLWFGEYGSNSPWDSRQAYREAAGLCWKVCAVDHPEAFAACAAYQAKHKPVHGVYGGVIPPGGR